MKKLFLLLIGIWTLNSCGPSTEEQKQLQLEELESIKFVDKVEEYERFLLKHPKGFFVDSVKGIIYEKKYNLVINKGNVDLLKNYVKSYPDSPFIEDCTKKIESIVYQSSDKGIKANALSLMSSCFKKRAKLSVKNGNVKLSANCIDVSRDCYSKGNSFSAVLSGRRKCQGILNTLQKKIQKLPGVKFVEVVDTSN